MYSSGKKALTSLPELLVDRKKDDECVDDMDHVDDDDDDEVSRVVSVYNLVVNGEKNIIKKVFSLPHLQRDV